MTALERIPGKFERLAAARHAKDLALTLLPGGHPRGLWFDVEAGDRVIVFVEGYCKHHIAEWAGKPLLLEEWQKAIIRQAFGWKRADGTRRYRTLYLEVPRKNGKSEVAAALALYLLIADDEPGAQIYSSATKTEQARIVWETAAAMVKASPELKRFVKTFRSSMTCDRVGSFFKPLGADSKTLDGLNPHGNVVDELHAHPNRKVWDVLDTAMGSRRQPMTIAITTAGSYEPEGIGWQLHEYASKILEGVIDDDSFFAMIYAADEPPADQSGYYFTEAAARQANPNYGISIKPEFLKGQTDKAQNQPGALNEVLRLHLNVWTRTVTKWLALDSWAECEPDPLMVGRDAAFGRELSLAGRKCFAGLDLSSKLDLAALALCFPAPDGYIDVVCRFWLPEATVTKYEKKGLRHYATWQRQGWLSTTPGNVIDYEFIEAEIEQLAAVYQIQQIAFDPWGATDIANRLKKKDLQMVEFIQGFRSFSEPSKDLEAKIVEKKIRHANNPVLRFCVSNAVISRDAAGNIKPDKEAAVEKIDGVVAVIMGMGRIIREEVDETNAYADGHGFRSL